MTKSHGRPISIDQAKEYIKAFTSEEIKMTGKNEKEIVIGNKIDLALFKEFMSQIEFFKALGVNINAIRIYHAKSDRQGSSSQKERDIVIVPVVDINETQKDIDFHKVYDRPLPLFFKSMEVAPEMYPLIIGEATPCPNVCNGQNNLNCP